MLSGRVTSKQLFAEHCIPGAPLAFGEVIPDAILDLVILCMPIYRVSSDRGASPCTKAGAANEYVQTMKMKMSRKKRLGVCGVFLFGAL